MANTIGFEPIVPQVVGGEARPLTPMNTSAPASTEASEPWRRSALVFSADHCLAG
jgi:hypothetical protein